MSKPAAKFLAASVSCALLSLAGCATNRPVYPQKKVSILRRFNNPQMRASALHALKPQAEAYRIDRQATLAYLGMLSGGGFALPAKKLFEMANGVPLYQLSASEQVLAYLGAKVNDESGASKVATRSIRDLVNRYCSPYSANNIPTAGVGAMRSIEVSFRNMLSSACFNELAGNEKVAKKRLFFAVTDIVSDTRLRSQLPVKFRDHGREVGIQWFESQLRKHNINLSDLVSN